MEHRLSLRHGAAGTFYPHMAARMRTESHIGRRTAVTAHLGASRKLSLHRVSEGDNNSRKRMRRAGLDGSD